MIEFMLERAGPVIAGTIIGAGGLAVGMADSILDENTLIPLGVFAAGVMLVSAAAYSLGVKITRLLDRVDTIERDMESIRNRCDERCYQLERNQ